MARRGWKGVVRSGCAGLAELEEGENFTMAMLRDWCLFGMKDDGIDGTKDFCYKERSIISVEIKSQNIKIRYWDRGIGFRVGTCCIFPTDIELVVRAETMLPSWL